MSYLGGEFRLSATTAGAQLAPALAASQDGSLFAAWHSFGQDGSGAGVYGRKFSAAGVALTPERALATTTAGEQVTPAVASRYGLLDAVWAAQGKDGDGYGIVLRRFNENLVPVSGGQGNEILVNQTTTGNQTGPRIAIADPQLVVVWTGPNPASPSQSEIWFRRYALNGNPLAGEVRANVVTSGNQVQPAVAMGADGSFLVVWSGPGDGSGQGVFARRFAANGNPTTGETLIATDTLYDQTAPAVAALAGGGYVVAWQSALQPGPTTIGPQPVVRARRFAANGTPAGGTIEVTEQSVDRQEAPSVAALDDGTFVVAWQAEILASGDLQTRGRHFGLTGEPLSGEFPLNTTAGGDQITPALAGQGGGRFTGAWASFGQDGGSWGVFAQRFATPVEPCVADSTTLCLNGDRFRVRVHWATQLGTSGEGQAVELTADTGYFWFFNPENVEIVIKALDACNPFGNFWIFAGGLTNVETTIVVTDTETGESATYGNPLGTPFQPITDTGGFFVCDGLAGAPPAGTATPAPADAAVETPAACAPGAETLCLNDGRFAVDVDWRAFDGSTGTGKAVPLTTDTGYFWFFAASNVEMVIKVLEACGVNGSYWVYAGGLTNVEVNLRVRDTVTGQLWSRTNPLGIDFQPIQDVNAFPVCP